MEILCRVFSPSCFVSYRPRLKAALRLDLSPSTLIDSSTMGDTPLASLSLTHVHYVGVLGSISRPNWLTIDLF